MRTKAKLLKLMSLWPPYFGSGIRVKNISSDLRSLDVEMKLRFWNRNYVGSHFGGSLYSMVDPFFMLMLIENLGRVHARFELSGEQIEELRTQADAQFKVEPVFSVQVLDEAGEVVAEVEKTLYVRKRDHG